MRFICSYSESMNFHYIMTEKLAYSMSYNFQNINTFWEVDIILIHIVI